jgi:hypothetical protein
MLREVSCSLYTPLLASVEYCVAGYVAWIGYFLGRLRCATLTVICLRFVIYFVVVDSRPILGFTDFRRFIPLGDLLTLHDFSLFVYPKPVIDLLFSVDTTSVVL